MEVESVALGHDPGSKTMKSAAKDLLEATTTATKEVLESAKENLGKNKKAVIVGAGVATGVGAVVAAPLVLSAAGFTAGGVAAGSMAAAWQASIGNVAAGSIFASLQSAGVLGLAASTKAAVGVAAGGIGSLVGKAFSSKGKDKDGNDGNVKDEERETDDEHNGGCNVDITNDDKKHLKDNVKDEMECNVKDGVDEVNDENGKEKKEIDDQDKGDNEAEFSPCVTDP